MCASRNHWVKAYLKDTFFAGMPTSGRSESINAFFDGYVNSNTMLNDFVTQYDKAIKSRRDAEEDEDFKTRNTKANLESNHPIEAIAGERNIRKLWTMNASYKAENLLYVHSETTTREVSELSLLSTQSKCNLAISEAKDCFHEIRRFDAIVDKFIQQQLERKRKRTEEETITSIVPSQSGFIPSQVSLNYVRDPTQAIKTKGRPKVASRIKSSIELAVKQQNACSYCREKGHNKSSYGCCKREAKRIIVSFESCP
ncbi:uncharacterized protein LOC133300996 [Gastrolobium bilobum]|uniref:uncharacterized protein LOC133300996 n=1 Tax=Gastrolobium bilobum TaxID=150636 RepID=UPI002AB25265|nr:uncharacterized protein LOC133300996 [Gastrolobium bilobum]